MDYAKCIWCGGKMYWGSDGCFSDFEWEIEGMVAYLTILVKEFPDFYKWGMNFMPLALNKQ